MSLHEAIEDLKTQIAEAKEREEGEVQEPEKVVEEIPEEKVEEKEPEKVEEKVEEKLDDGGYARLRREAAAAKKKEQEADARAEAERAKREELEALLNPAEDKQERQIPPELQEVIESHNERKAEREFTALEQDFRRKHPEYDAITAEYSIALAQSIKIQNPRLSSSDVAEETKKAILRKAGAFVRAGFDPIEELFHEAKELGFTGKSMQKQEKVEEKEDPQADMKKVAENRKRSAGTAASTARAEDSMTRAHMMQNGLPTNAEWMKLSPSQKRALMQGA